MLFISNVSNYTPSTNNKKVKLYPPFGGKIDNNAVTTGSQDIGVGTSVIALCLDATSGASVWGVKFA
jgi:hypothetical protein